MRRRLTSFYVLGLLSLISLALALSPRVLTGAAQSAVNVAAAAQGAAASASSSHVSGNYPASAVIDGDRTGGSWGTTSGGWNDDTQGEYASDWVEVNFAAASPIGEIDVFTLRDGYRDNQTPPTLSETFSAGENAGYGLTHFEVQYFDAGVGLWRTVPGGNVTGNDNVWRRFSFPAVSTAKIRVAAHGAAPWTSAALNYSRLVEVEAYSASTNVALAANGGWARASSELNADFPASSVIDGERTGYNWGRGGFGSGWSDATENEYSTDWLRVDFFGGVQRSIGEVDVYTLRDGYGTKAGDPDVFETFSSADDTGQGATDYDVQYLTAAGWRLVPGGKIVNNDRVRRQLKFSPISTSAVRVAVHRGVAFTASANNWSRLVEVEAWEGETATGAVAGGGGLPSGTGRDVGGKTTPTATQSLAASGPAVMNVLEHPAGSNNQNFRIGLTGFSVSSVPGAYRVYGTGGYHHMRWNFSNQFIFTKYHRTVVWPDYMDFDGIGDCAHTKDPKVWDSKCATESIGYFWKQIACPSPNPGNVACQSNDRWNASPGTYNVTPTPTPGVWPNSFGQGYGTPGYTPVVDIGKVNGVALQPAAPCATPAGQTIWVNDTLPRDAVAGGLSEGWNWVGSNPSPFNGRHAHQSNVVAGVHQHQFQDATNLLDIQTGDLLVSYVYLDPANPPTEVMLQWRDAAGSFEHRAYWGANQIIRGTNGTNSRRFVGALPAAGAWVRLEVPASQVGLEGVNVNGMAFVLYGGRATWDYAGKIKPVSGPCPPRTGPSGGTNGFHAYNPNEFATGTANSKAVQVKYPNGTSRWFMVFNKMIHPASITYYTDFAAGTKKNDTLDVGGGADNWQVLWATSPDGVDWTVHQQVLFRSTKERSENWTGLLLTDMFIDGGYFYVLFQDLVDPHLYLARSRIDLANPSSATGYVQNTAEGWSVATTPLVSGQYTWKRLPLGQQINFNDIDNTPASPVVAYRVMPAINSPWGGYVKQASVARIFTAAAANSPSRFFGVTNDGTIVQLWSTADLSTPFQFESNVNLAPTIEPGGNGWEFSFNHYPDNAPATPRIIGPALDLWVQEKDQGLVRYSANVSNF
jgi:hypothetical protein